MHRQYYHLARLHSAVATSDGDKLESQKKKLLRSLAQLVGLFDMLHGYISYKLALLGFIYEPMILPAICLNGNVTTLALALALSLLPKWKHVTRCQLVSNSSSNKSFGFSFELWQTQASSPLLLPSPLRILPQIIPATFFLRPRRHVCISIWVFHSPLRVWFFLFAACDKIINQRWIR